MRAVQRRGFGPGQGCDCRQRLAPQPIAQAPGEMLGPSRHDDAVVRQMDAAPGRRVMDDMARSAPIGDRRTRLKGNKGRYPIQPGKQPC